MSSLQLGDLPAAGSTDVSQFTLAFAIMDHVSFGLAKVVIFKDGGKAMQLEGADAALVTVQELQQVLGGARYT